MWLKLGMQTGQLYPSDLTDQQCRILAPLVPAPAKRGCKPTPWRAVLNAIFYLLRSGGAWRILPKEYPPWQTVYGWFRRWQRTGVWPQIHAAWRVRVRQRSGKQAQPSAGIHTGTAQENLGVEFQRNVSQYFGHRRVFDPMRPRRSREMAELSGHIFHRLPVILVNQLIINLFRDAVHLYFHLALRNERAFISATAADNLYSDHQQYL